MAISSSGARGDAAVLGRGLRVVGRVRGDGDLRVEADIEGDIAVSGELSLGPGAVVSGVVQGASVVVAGQLTGDARAEDAVAVTADGRMRGDVHAKHFSLEEGAEFEGRVEADFDLPETIA